MHRSHSSSNLYLASVSLSFFFLKASLLTGDLIGALQFALNRHVNNSSAAVLLPKMNIVFEKCERFALTQSTRERAAESGGFDKHDYLAIKLLPGLDELQVFWVQFRRPHLRSFTQEVNPELKENSLRSGSSFSFRTLVLSHFVHALGIWILMICWTDTAAFFEKTLSVQCAKAFGSICQVTFFAIMSDVTKRWS